MLPLARAFDNLCAVFVALLPTLALTFGANALIGDGCLVPADPVPALTQSEPLPPPPDASQAIESVDASVSAAALILQLDNVEIEWDILDRVEQCCPYHSHHLRYHKGPRWYEDW